jgi:hypothetical protein
LNRIKSNRISTADRRHLRSLSDSLTFGSKPRQIEKFQFNISILRSRQSLSIQHSRSSERLLTNCRTEIVWLIPSQFHLSIATFFNVLLAISSYSPVISLLFHLIWLIRQSQFADGWERLHGFWSFSESICIGFGAITSRPDFHHTMDTLFISHSLHLRLRYAFVTWIVFDRLSMLMAMLWTNMSVEMAKLIECRRSEKWQ